MDGTSAVPETSRTRGILRGVVVLADGRSILVLHRSAQPKIFQRDGQHLLTFNEAIPRDGHGANDGHVTIVTGGQWHPHEKMQC